MAAKKQRTRLKAKVTVNGVSKWVQGYTKRELEQKKVEVRQRMITGYSTKDMAFRDLAVQWWQNIQRRTYRKPSTLQTNTTYMNRYILPEIDPMLMCKAVRRLHFQRILDAACDRGLTRKRVSGILRLLHLMNLYGTEQGLMAADYTSNCTVNVTEPEQQTEEIELICLSEQQIHNLLTYSVGTAMETPVRLMYYLGLRRGEAYGLTWNDVDFDTSTIHIHRQIDFVNGQVSTTKTRSSVRTVTMPNDLVRYLKSIRAVGDTPICQKVTRKTYYINWIRLMLRCGYAHHVQGRPDQIAYPNYVCDFSPHAFRHTYVTLLYQAGVDPVSASRLVGHSSYKTTADKYTAIREYKQKSNAEKIDDVFKSRQKVGSE